MWIKIEEKECENISSKKRTFIFLRHLLLIALSKCPQSVNQLSNNSGINWKTVDNHMIHLIGKGFVKVVHNTPYIKIYNLSEKGKKYLEFLKHRFQKTHIKEVDLEALGAANGNIDREFAIFQTTGGGLL